jgi:hypothetical protein
MLRTSKFSAVLIALFISVGAMAQSATGPTSTTSTQSGASEGVKDTPAGVSENGGSKMKMKKMSKADRKAMKAKRKGAMSDSSMQKETTGAGGTTASP